MHDARSLIDRFASLRVLVVGDAVLDVWLYGAAGRMSREGPVPVVDVQRRDPAPGAAANCARNAADLGASVRYLGVVGDDEPGRELRAALAAAGVDVSGVVVDPGGTTAVKQRLVCEGQVLARFDTAGGRWADATLAELNRALQDTARADDLVVLADYGGGVLDGAVRRTFARIRPELGGVVVVDGHDFAGWAACAPTALSPTATEALGLLGLSAESGDRIELLEQHSARLLEAAGADLVLTTLDADGTLLHGRDRSPYRTRTRPAAVQHTCGAGDTTATTFGMALAAGADPVQAAELAQAAADLVVREPGTCTCSAAALRERCTEDEAYLGRRTAALVDRVAASRDAGRRIVFTNGCFDVLHAGHAHYLRQAKALGDLLVVAVNSDRSVRRLKGPGRPIVGEDERAGLVAALDPVDLVVLFDEPTAVRLIELLRPDVYVKGGDYNVDMLPEADAVAAVGGEVVTVDYLADHSTTDLVQRIRAHSPAPAERSG